MLAVGEVGDDPRDGRQPALLRRSHESIHRLDVPELPVATDGGEVRERVPRARRPGLELAWMTSQLATVVAVRLLAGNEVVRPAHSGLVEEVRQIGPGVQRTSGEDLAVRRRPLGRVGEVVLTTAR